MKKYIQKITMVLIAAMSFTIASASAQHFVELTAEEKIALVGGASCTLCKSGGPDCAHNSHPPVPGQPCDPNHSISEHNCQRTNSNYACASDSARRSIDCNQVIMDCQKASQIICGYDDNPDNPGWRWYVSNNQFPCGNVSGCWDMGSDDCPQSNPAD